MPNKGHCLLIFILSSLKLLAQSGENSPTVFDQFFKNYYLVNPSIQDRTEKFAVKLGNRALTGLFQGVNRFYADAHLSFANSTQEKQHAIGVLVMNNRDGDYFQRNRAYLRYSWQTTLTESASLSAGASFGVVSYTFGGSAASAGGTSTSPDANVGIWYLREKLKFGVSYQQVFSPQVRPLNQLFSLNKYWNANLIYRMEFSPSVSLSTHMYAKWDPLLPFYGEIAPIFSLTEWFEIGVNYRHQRGVALLIGLPKIPIGSSHVQVMASYLASTRKLSSQNDSVLEFSLGYILPSE